MDEDRELQRRPPTGFRWVRDQAFIDRLTELLKTKTAAEVAAEVSADLDYDYEISDSMIRKLKTAPLEEIPSSVLIGPICRKYRWPVPPGADDNVPLATGTAAIYELQGLAPERAAKILKYANSELDAARKEAELVQLTPVDSGKRGT